MSGILSSFFGGIVSVAKDTYFNLVTLLLPGNGTNGAQNNTFLDSSTNNFTITRNGNTTQGTFSPFSQTGWSNNFNGSSDSIEFASANTANAMGTGDWTVEAWVYITKTDNQYFFDTLGSGAGATNAIRLRINTSNQLDYSEYSTSVLSGGTVSLHTWTHVAASRSGTTLRLFVNGSQVASATNSSNLVCGTSRPIVGREGYTAGQYIQGYISNLRSVKGQALYTGAFTPSTTPLTTTSQGATASNVSLLTCQSNRFVDNSNGAFVPTISGNTSVQAFSPFAPTAAYSAATNGGSGYFDGSGDYLNTAANAAFDFGTGAFTVEAWFYPTDTVSDGIVATSNNTAWGCVWIWTFGTEVRLRATASTSGADLAIGGGAFQVNAWNHVAAVRSGNDFSLYLNGTRVATGTSTTALKTGCNAAIGCMYDNSYNSFYSGYIASVRMVKGGALYSGTTYTIPTAPFTTSVSAGTVSLLTNFTNAGITDATAKNVLETVGNAQISTTQSKFGGASISFDGTGDWLLLPHTVDQMLGTGAFTIEMWIYRNASGTYGLVGKGTGTTGWLVSLNSSNQVVFTYGSSTITSTGTISATTWTYIAVVREGTGTNQTKIYISGSNDGTGTVSTDFNQTNAMYVGADRTGGSAFNGYIDDLRITKGYARTIATPSSAFALQ